MKAIIFIMIIFMYQLSFANSYDSYAQGDFIKAFHQITEEINSNQVDSIENLMNMALSIWSQSPSLSITKIVELNKLVIQKDKTGFIQKRASFDIKYLKQWNKISKLSKEDLKKEIKQTNLIPDKLTEYNHDKESKLRIYQLRLDSLK